MLVLQSVAPVSSASLSGGLASNGSLLSHASRSGTRLAQAGRSYSFELYVTAAWFAVKWSRNSLAASGFSAWVGTIQLYSTCCAAIAVAGPSRAGTKKMSSEIAGSVSWADRQAEIE